VSKTKQADGGIHEDQLLNFLVNRLDEEVSLSLANNAEITAEDIYEGPRRRLRRRDPLSLRSVRRARTPAGNTVLYHLRTKFEPEQLERVANTLLRKDLDELLPNRWRSFQTSTCYYGDEDDTDGLYHSQAKRGTTAFHAYATLYARVKNKHYTLAVRRLTDGDTASSVIAEFLGLLDGLDLDVKAVYLDREFYDSKCLTLLQAHNHAYVMPVVRWGKTIKQELSEGWSRVIQHDMTAKLDGHSWTVEFPVYIDCTYQNGRYDDHGVARHGYAADAPFIDSPRDARYHYAKTLRYRGELPTFRAKYCDDLDTESGRPVAVRCGKPAVTERLAVSALGVRGDARRGGRRLWQWSFKEFINMIQRAAWTALAVRRAVPQTGHRTTGLAGNHQPDSLQREVATLSRRRQPPPTATALGRFVEDSLVETVSATAPPQNSGFRNS